MTVITKPPAPPAQPTEVPQAPPGLLVETRSVWRAFWESGAASWVDRRAHLARLLRWIRDVDQWNWIQRDLRPARPRAWAPPDPPPDLSADAIEIWTRAVAIRRFGNLELLAAYCEAVARYRKASQTLERDGPLSRARNGAIARSPLHQVMLDNAALMRQLARELELDSDAADQVIPGVFDSSRPWLSRGSTGQVTRHPSAEEIDKLDARIHRAEVEFGMTPYAGVRIGLAGAQGALTAEQLGRLIAERSKRDPDPAGEDWATGFARV